MDLGSSYCFSFGQVFWIIRVADATDASVAAIRQLRISVNKEQIPVSLFRLDILFDLRPVRNGGLFLFSFRK